MSCDVGEVTEGLENELLSLLLRHRIFTYVTWRAAHVVNQFVGNWRIVIFRFVIKTNRKLREKEKVNIGRLLLTNRDFYTNHCEFLIK